MRFLKLSQRTFGGIVPLPAGCTCVRAVFRERFLNLGDAVRSWSLLAPLAVMGSPGVFFVVRGAVRRFLRSGALRSRRSGEQTQPRCQEQRRNQQLGYANVHVRCRDGTFVLPDFAPFDAILVSAAAPRYCWLFGTEPDRYSVSIRSLSWRRRTLKTMSSPGLSLETTLR